ncbi:MAG: type II protein secretion system D protein [Epsilonproteobacteria bacterium]|nr:type II protein secretion system D protein [Campylobacterota bacterium]
MRFALLFIGMLLFAKCGSFSVQNSDDPQNRESVGEFLNHLLVQKCALNIAYSEDKVFEKLNYKMPYINFKNYTLKEILDFLLVKKLNLVYSIDKNTVEIKYLINKTYHINFLPGRRDGVSSINTGGNNVKSTYNFLIWDKIKDDINSILKANADKIVRSVAFKDQKGEVYQKNVISHYPLIAPVVNKEAGLITVSATLRQIRALEKYLNALKQSLTKEVLIDVKIYSVTLGRSHTNGINWSNLSLSLPYSSVPLRASYIGGSASVFNAARFNTQAFLNFLAKNGNVNSLSNPKIITLNNQKALISVGEVLNYSLPKTVFDKDGNPISSEYEPKSVFVGVILDITPHIQNDDIILNIAPTINSLTDQNQIYDTQRLQRGIKPDTQENKILSVIKVKNGSTVVLGGLITTQKSIRINGVPVLDKIPILKYLFSSKEEVSNKKELVFVITPHILDLNKKVNLRNFLTKSEK